jgi:hypothetical protein
MKVGFDIDGVCVEQDIAVLRIIDLMDKKEDREEVMKFYCNKRTQLLNPLDFIADTDELFLITGRSKENEALTAQWAKKYYPQATLIVTKNIMPDKNLSLSDKNDTDGWYTMQSKLKAQYINELGIEVYFEDAPEVVQCLRKMCPQTKIIQYGGRCF